MEVASCRNIKNYNIVTSIDSTSTITYGNDHSQKEAKAIYDYLIKSGVTANRISYKEMGLNGEVRKKKYVLTV